jgi:hypothetical protein
MRRYLPCLLCLTVLGLLPLGCVSVGMLPLGKGPKPCTLKGETMQVFRDRPEGRSYTELAMRTADLQCSDMIRIMTHRCGGTKSEIRNKAGRKLQIWYPKRNGG